MIDDREAETREFGAWAMTSAFCAAPTAQLDELSGDDALELLRAARADTLAG